jgi:single-strand DNA-binding protein
MAGVNKAILIGNLGADPEARYTQGGSAVANFRIATSEKWTGKDGQPQERTEWHRIVTFGRLAETCRDYLSKGRQVYVEGRIQTRQWDDRDGNKRWTTEIVAQTVRFLGRAGDREEAAATPPSASESKPYYGGGDQGGGDQGGGNQGGGESSPPPIGDDDVPF